MSDTTLNIGDGIKVGQYSESEIIVGAWIDDKPIYRKVLTFTNPTFTSNTLIVNHGVSNLDWLVRADAVALRTDADTFQVLTRTGNSDAIGTWLYDLGDIKKSGTIQILKGTSQTCSKLIVILEYTKTTT